MKKNGFTFKAVSSAAISTLLFFPAASVFAASPDATKVANYLPTDISTHWAKDTINNLIQAGIVNGYKDGQTVTAMPANPITRAEFVKILVQALNLKEAPNQAKTFTDVSDQWFAESIRVASSLNLVNGRAGIITGKEAGIAAPQSNATRVEAMLMLERSLKAEKSDLPNAEELEKLVVDYDKAAYQALADTAAHADNNGLPLDQSSVINARYTTNFMLDYSEYSLQLLDYLSE